MSHPYHIFDEPQGPFRFNAAGEIVESSPMSGSQVEHLASPLHYLHGHPLVPSSPDPCYAYYGDSVTIPTNGIEPTMEAIMEPITTLETHNDGSPRWDPSAYLQDFASEGNVTFPKTRMPHHVEPYNVSLSSVQSDHGELGDNCTEDLSNLSKSSMSPESNAIKDSGTSQAGALSSPATVNNFVTSGSSNPQEHVILPSILPGNKDPEAYIATFTKDGKPFFKCLWKRCKGTAFWEQDEIHKHVKAHIIKMTHECLCGSIFSNFQAAQKHCRNAKSTGNICPTWKKTKRNRIMQTRTDRGATSIYSFQQFPNSNLLKGNFLVSRKTNLIAYGTPGAKRLCKRKVCRRSESIILLQAGVIIKKHIQISAGPSSGYYLATWRNLRWAGGVPEINVNGNHATSNLTVQSNDSHTDAVSVVPSGTNIENAGNSSGNSANLQEPLPNISKSVPNKKRHGILPFTPPGQRNSETYISNFTTTNGRPFFGCLWKECRGLSFWEHAEARDHVYKRFLQKGYECSW
ncbi:hypothetical protein M422DRAFT_245180 [Sphaerobolus stellatus SS14]|nr:hypothetical protein M422DRAFT_245180 [Sphaerobolus stellatus SS14]